MASLEWRRNGLKVPDVVRDATDSYFDDQDTIGLWLAEWTERDPRTFTLTAELFKNWKSWCDRGNHHVGTEQAFSDDLGDHGFERARKNYGRGFRGIVLRPNDAPGSWEG